MYAVERVYEYRSEILGQMVKIHDPGNGWLSATCEDGTVYKAEEIKILQSVNEQIDPLVHLVKRMFGGTIQRIPTAEPTVKPPQVRKIEQLSFEMRKGDNS